jgi:hypothetical protein
MPNSAATYQTHAEIRAQIVSMIEAVPSSGEVMDLWGQFPSWALSDVPTDTGGPWWNIRRISNAQEWPDGAVNDYQGPEVEEKITCELLLRFPWTLDEANGYTGASEPVFEALVDAVQTAFLQQMNLDTTVYDASPLDYDSGQTGFISVPCGYGEMVCHYARFELLIQQFQSTVEPVIPVIPQFQSTEEPVIPPEVNPDF